MVVKMYMFSPCLIMLILFYLFPKICLFFQDSLRDIPYGLLSNISANLEHEYCFNRHLVAPRKFKTLPLESLFSLVTPFFIFVSKIFHPFSLAKIALTALHRNMR